MLRHALILFTVVTVILAAATRSPLEEKPEEYKNCNGCWVSAIKQIIPTGQTYRRPSRCEVYHCTADYVDYMSCSPVRAEPSCNTTIDLSLPYPNCCPIVVCPPATE